MAHSILRLGISVYLLNEHKRENRTKTYVSSNPGRHQIAALHVRRQAVHPFFAVSQAVRWDVARPRVSEGRL